MMNSFTQQLKRLTDDERAVSPVVGFVLIFALIMIVFTIYQADVVPAQNEEVEFKHSQTVEGEMSQLNDAIQQAGTSGVPQSATIATGVQYPDRALAINPGSPAGSLSTSEPRTVTVSGLTDGSGYWSATDRTLETRFVTYQPSYNLLQQETEYRLENGILVKDFKNENDPMIESSNLLSNNGRQINLQFVTGDLSESGTSASVTATPVSTSTEYLHVQPAGDSGEISVPTSLSQDVWRNEIVGDAEHISVTVNGGMATLVLDGGREYELRLTEVNLGGGGEPSATYLKSEDPQDPSETIDATVGESETFAVSARDEFGNPYSGVTVTAASGTDDLTPVGDEEVQTDDKGRAKFTYTPDSAADGMTVDITLRDDSGDPIDTITYVLDVSDGSDEDDTGSGIGTGFGEIDNGYDIDIIITDVSPGQGNGPASVTFENLGSDTADATNVRISGFSIQGQIESGDTILFAGETIPLNANEAEIPSGSLEITGGGTTTVDIGSIGNQGGFLILDIRFEKGGDTVVGTYAVSIPG